MGRPISLCSFGPDHDRICFVYAIKPGDGILQWGLTHFNKGDGLFSLSFTVSISAGF